MKCLAGREYAMLFWAACLRRRLDRQKKITPLAPLSAKKTISLSFLFAFAFFVFLGMFVSDQRLSSRCKLPGGHKNHNNKYLAVLS